jgi:lipid-A-disaccharide synthase
LSSVVMAASGTVTLESAISGTPMVIIYKVSPISYWLGRALIQVKHIGLVNLITGRKIVPELIQDQASPIRIADTVFNMLSDASGLEKIRLELLQVKDKLGGPGASERVADIAIGMLHDA